MNWAARLVEQHSLFYRAAPYANMLLLRVVFARLTTTVRFSLSRTTAGESPRERLRASSYLAFAAFLSGVFLSSELRNIIMGAQMYRKLRLPLSSIIVVVLATEDVFPPEPLGEGGIL